MPIDGTARLQRALTVEFITKRRLNLSAVWFRPQGSDPNADDALADKLDVDLGAWDGPEHNVGVRLENGHLELRIKAGDDAFAHAFFLAAEHLRIDARGAFGVDRISSVILNVEDQELIEPWAPRWPKGFKDKHGHWTETTVRTSSMATKSAKAIYRFSKPLPGSITPEGVVVWRPKGKAAALDVDIGDRGSRAARARADGHGRADPRARLCDARRLDPDLPRRADRLGLDPDAQPRRLDRPRRGRGPRHQRQGQVAWRAYAGALSTRARPRST